MPRCFYHAVRLRDDTPQILVSRVADPRALKMDNTQFLPERRGLKQPQGSPLEWVAVSGEVSPAAIAILEHATTGRQMTRRYALRFQQQVLDRLPERGWILRADQVRFWVASTRRQEQALQELTYSIRLGID